MPNGSFEEYYWCPSNTEGYYIDACRYWTSPNTGTPDYFNECSTDYDNLLQRFMFSVPENYIGYQYARTGKAYAGLVQTQTYSPNFTPLEQTFSEYIQVKLTETLDQGKIYELKFFVSNVTNNPCGNSIGAYFSSEEVNQDNYHNLTVDNQFQSDLSVFICDSSNWHELSYKFIADGTENYLIIGVFTLLPETQMIDSNGEVISGVDLGDYGANQYYYIDDVSLVEIDFSLPNVFSPNGDGLNDRLILFGIPTGFSFTIVNRWGNVIFETIFPNDEFWDGHFNGKSCQEGVYFYIIRNTESNSDENLKTGFIHLIK